MGQALEERNGDKMRRSVIAVLLLAVVACGGQSSTSTRVTSDTGFVIQGSPESSPGATWTYRGTVAGTTYDLSGVLLKPVGPGPFPAVILSHGSEGSAGFFASLIAPTMVQWGLVCIATNYTHATGVPIGAPGDASEPGASAANVLRAHMTFELLGRLGYVDMSRVALHGHSMGAYVNAALAGAFPADFRVGSQTGGGVRPVEIFAGPAPTIGQTKTIQTPFQLHHGELDTTVPLSYDVRFDSLLTARGIEHVLYTYPGEDHLQVRLDPTMLERVHSWYTAHGMF
jgi:dienelactone hydrolase